MARSTARGRNYWSQRIAALDPAVDYHEIYRIMAAHEFPWDIMQSLSFALYRTYAVPSIGKLLARTGELTDRTQKRYDDTVLILDAVLEHGFESPQARTAFSRMNRMHGAYAISNDDMRYVLSTFVVIPMRWLEAYGWRAPTPHERAAAVHYYRALGARMGIKEIPDSFQAFEELLDDYERRHFAFSEPSRAVSDATLDLMTTFPPHSFLPARLARRMAMAVMDPPLLDAFGYPHPSAVERAVAAGTLRLRSAFVRRRPPRLTPRYGRQSSYVRSYPMGYNLELLGTFPQRTAV